MTSEGSTIPVETFSVADGGKIGKVLSSDSSREETEASLEGRMPSQSDASDSIITEASPFAGTGFETPGAVLLAPPYDRIASPELKPVDSVAAESKGESSGANAKDELSTSSRSPTLSEAAARDERANDSDLDDPDIPVNIEAAAVEEKVVTDLVNHPAIQKTAEKLHPLLISFDGVHNFRDLSSYPSTVDGKQIRKNALFRSGQLDLATARDKDFFRHHLKAVIDLRDPHEYESVAPSSSSVPVHGAYGNAHGLRSRFVRRMRALHRREASTSTNLAPNLVQIKMPEPIEKAVSGEVSDSKQGSGITMPSASATDVETEQQVFRVPLASMKALKKLAWNSATLQEKARFLFTRFVLCRKKESEAIMTRVVGRQGLLGYNRVLVLYSHERVARVLQLIATPGHVPVVFHCTHGKDRTGLVAALVLSILGVAREYVIADYASSAEFIPAAAFKEMLARPGFTAEEWAHSPPLVIMKTLELIDQTYGSVNGYLDAIGFTHEWRERMRSQLLEDTPPPLTPSRAHDEDELKQRAQDHVVHAVAQAVKEAQPALQNAMKDANV